MEEALSEVKTNHNPQLQAMDKTNGQRLTEMENGVGQLVEGEKEPQETHKRIEEDVGALQVDLEQRQQEDSNVFTVIDEQVEEIKEEQAQLHSELNSVYCSVDIPIPLPPIVISAPNGIAPSDADPDVTVRLVVHSSSASSSSVSSSAHTSELEDSPQDLIDLRTPPPNDKNHQSSRSVGGSEADSGLDSQRASVVDSATTLGDAYSATSLPLSNQHRVEATSSPFGDPASPAQLAGSTNEGSILQSLRPAAESNRPPSNSWAPLSLISNGDKQDEEDDKGTDSSNVEVPRSGSEVLRIPTTVPSAGLSNIPDSSLNPSSLSQTTDLSVLSLNSTLGDQSLFLSFPSAGNAEGVPAPPADSAHLLDRREPVSVVFAPGAPDLSVVPLDDVSVLADSGLATAEPGSSVIAPPTGVADTYSTQLTQDHLAGQHEPVSQVPQPHYSDTSSPQWLAIEQQLASSQEEVLLSKSQLAVQVKLVGQLQQQVSTLERQLRAQERAHQSHEENQAEELRCAQEKISSLVQQLESSDGGQLNTSQLVKETEELLNDYREMEAQLKEGQDLMAKERAEFLKEKQEMEKKQQLMESELSSVECKLQAMVHENAAMRKANHDLRQKQGHLETELRQTESQGKERVERLEEKLHAKTAKLRELQELTELIPSRAESEDRLKLEISALQSELASTRHELATLRSRRDPNEAKELAERVNQLQSELHQKVQTCTSLQEQLNQAKLALKASQEAEAHSKAAEAEPRQELARLRELLEQRESELQGAFVEKEKAEEQHRSLQSQTSILKSHADDLQTEMQKSMSHVASICAALEEKEKEVESLLKENVTLTCQLSEAQADSKKFLQAYEKAVGEVQEVQEDKERLAANLKSAKKELEEVTVLKAQLDNRITGMSSEMAEQEEYREVQVSDLRRSLENVQEQLREKSVELESVKTALQQQQTATKKRSPTEDEKEVKENKASLTGEDQAESPFLNSPERLKEHYERELKCLEEKLKSEHLGEIALLRLQHADEMKQERERLPAQGAGKLERDEGMAVVLVNEDELQEIIDLAPLLEQHAEQLRDMCNETGQWIGRRSPIKGPVVSDSQVHNGSQQDSVALDELASWKGLCLKHQQEAVHLRMAVQTLQKKVSDLQSTLAGAEESMRKADSTISHLKTELQASIAKEVQLRQAVEAERRLASELKGKADAEDLIKRELERARAQLREAEANLMETESVNKKLQQNLDRAHQQLVLANHDAAKSNDMLRQNMREVERLQSQLDELDSSDHRRGGESQAMAALDSKLRSKEIERAKAVDQYLQERVSLSRAKGEIEALQVKLKLLQSQDQHHLKQYDTTMTRVAALEKSLSELQRSAQSSGPHQQQEEIQAKYRQMKARLCQLDWKCRSLTFQKRYLASEVDAFYHTQQASLMLLRDMGAPVPTCGRLASTRRRGTRFRVAARAVMAAVRLRFLYRKRSRLTAIASSSTDTGSKKNSRGIAQHPLQASPQRQTSLIPQGTTPPPTSRMKPLPSTHHKPKLSPPTRPHPQPSPPTRPHLTTEPHPQHSPPTRPRLQHSPPTQPRLPSPTSASLTTRTKSTSPKPDHSSHTPSPSLASPPSKLSASLLHAQPTNKGTATDRKQPRSAAHSSHAQVSDYIKRLEQLQQRMNKTRKHISEH